jgi:hypothetical protein
MNITEDYVSFETAKLLKEKGFPQNPYICNTAYTLKGKFSNNAKSFVHNFAEFNKCGINPRTYSMAPTLQMTMKWLEKEKHIAIIPVLSSILDNEKFLWDVKIVVAETGEKYSQGWVYEDKENAYDAAIKYCLENLI